MDSNQNPELIVETVVEERREVRRGFLRHLSQFDKLAKLITLVVAFILPIFFIPSAYTTVEYSKHVLLVGATLVAAFAWVLARLESGVVSVPRTPVVWGGMLIVIGYALSAAFSPEPMKSLLGLGFETGSAISVAAFIFLMFFASVYLRSENIIKRFYKAILYSALAVAVFQVVHLVAPSLLLPTIFSIPTDNLIGKWNDFGIFFGLATLMALMALDLPLGIGISTALATTVLVVGLVVVLLTNVPFVWLLLGVAAIVLLVYRVTAGFGWSGYRLDKKTLLRPSLLVLVCALFFSFTSRLTADENQSFVLRMLGGMQQNLVVWENAKGIAALEARPSEDATLTVASAVLKERPLLGVGPNRFDVAWRTHKPDVITQSLFWNTDFTSGYGYILSAAVTVGLVGMLAWGLFLLGVLFTGLRGMRRTSPDSARYSLFLALFLATLYLWSLAIIYVPENTILSLAFLFTGILIGLEVHWGIVAVSEWSFFSRPRMRFASVLGFVFLLLAIGVTAFVTSKRLVALGAYQKALAVVGRNNDLDTASLLLIKAATNDPQDLYFRALSEVTLGRATRVLNEQGVNQDDQRQRFEKLYVDARVYGEEAVRLEPNNPRNHLALGRVLELLVNAKVEGAYARALDAYNDALALNEKNPEPYLDLARLELANSNTVKARSYAEKGLALKQNYNELIFLVSQIEEREGNLGKAIDNAKQSVALAPNDIGLLFRLGALLYTDGQYRDAGAAFDRAVSLNASYANARYYLGLSLDKLGEKEQAIAQFERLRQENPENQELAGIIANLKAGRGALENAPAPEPEEEEKKPSVKR